MKKIGIGDGEDIWKQHGTHIRHITSCGEAGEQEIETNKNEIAKDRIPDSNKDKLNFDLLPFQPLR
jgi:hypothetical protein